MIINTINKTAPSVIHAPDESEIWNKLVKLENLSDKKFKNHDDLLILTWNNFKTSPLEECLIKRNLSFEALGKDINIWNNLNKFTLNLEAIQNSNKKYIMGLDANDVLVVRDPKFIVDEFEKNDCELMFNAESFFYPNFMDIRYYLENKKFQDSIGKTKYRFLNSGSWIGKRDFCLKFFEDCSNIRIWEMFDCTGRMKLFNCDQSVVHSVFKKYYPKVQLDYFCKIFFNIALINPNEIKIANKLL